MRPDGRPSGPRRPEQARVFFALWPDERVRAALHQAALACARSLGGRVMQPQTLHLTLAFIGDVGLDQLPALHAAAAAVAGRTFTLTLDRLGFWGHNHILWAGSRQGEPALSQLAEDLGGRLQAAGWPTGMKAGQPFAPHITLLRNVDAKRPELPPLPPVEWACERFVLMRSRLSERGSAYETLAHWDLCRNAGEC